MNTKKRNNQKLVFKQDLLKIALQKKAMKSKINLLSSVLTSGDGNLEKQYNLFKQNKKTARNAHVPMESPKNLDIDAIRQDLRKENNMLDTALDFRSSSEMPIHSLLADHVTTVR